MKPDAETEACLEALRQPRDADTLIALFRARVAQRADQPFLLYGERCLSWQMVADLAGRWARYLASKGCRPGDRLVTILPNCDSQVVLLLACAEAGLVFTPINAAGNAADIAAALTVAEPAFIIASAAVGPKVTCAMAGLNAGPILLLEADSLALPAIQHRDVNLPPAVPDAPLAIVFTSGTTGVPKGAVHGNRTYVLAAEIAAYRMRLVPQDCLMVILPLFHLNALFYSVGGAIVAGARLLIEPQFSATQFWHSVARHGVTQVNMIAAIGNILLKRDRAEFPGNASLRKVSAAPVAADVAQRLRQAFGIETIVESYGMTEAPGIAQVDFHDHDHRACLGRAIRHPLTDAAISEIRIVDDKRRELPQGSIGRIMLRAVTMMQGYFRRPDLADRIDAEGWFLTEDRGRVDAEGFHYFCGRTAEMIRCRGENVAASEIEAVLLQHPMVSDAGCIGVPSELGEEDILAAIAPRPDCRIDPEEFAAFCHARLSRHKWPHYLLLRDVLPKTPTEKVARHRLRDDPELLRQAIRLQGDGA